MYLFQLFKVFIYWVESKTTENKVKEVLKTFGVVLYNYTLDLRWLDWIFWGWYLPSLSINYVGMSKDIEKRLPQLYYIKMKIS